MFGMHKQKTITLTFLLIDLMLSKVLVCKRNKRKAKKEAEKAKFSYSVSFEVTYVWGWVVEGFFNIF